MENQTNFEKIQSTAASHMLKQSCFLKTEFQSVKGRMDHARTGDKLKEKP